MGYLDNSGLAYFWGKVKALINAKAPTSHASTATTYGVANASKYGHAKASGTTPKALGTAAVGSETAAFARGDHVHPMPTAAQVGALDADGTAANASKLGGKAPEYYIQPLNLLDNSDFTNPVNQLGQTNYTDNTYTIDRWLLQSSGVKSALTIGTGNIQLANNAAIGKTIFTQRLAALPFGVYTFALATNHGITTVVTNVTGNNIDYPASTIGNSDWRININTEGAFPQVRVFNETANASTLMLYWAALYEGEYTAETLPPYVPKGYEVELAKCRMYYRPKEFLDCVRVSGQYFSISKNVEMFGVPTANMVSFSPYGFNNVTDFSGCTLTISQIAKGVQQITYASLPTCSEHLAGGLVVDLDSRL